MRTGIHIKNQIYSDEALLMRLASQADGLTRDWTCRRDRADLGRIWILEEGVAWHEIRNVDYELTNGVSELQFAIWAGDALDRLEEDERPSVDDLMAARERIEKAREQALGGRNLLTKALKWARYGDMGDTFTPVPGFGQSGRLPLEIERPLLLKPSDIPTPQIEMTEIVDGEWDDVAEEALAVDEASRGPSIRERALRMMEEMKL